MRASTADEAVWNFRSGWNVAALNCTRPQHAPMLEGYQAPSSTPYQGSWPQSTPRSTGNIRQLQSTDRAATAAREAYMTQVYNYFALPPARGGLCDAALAAGE